MFACTNAAWSIGMCDRCSIASLTDSEGCQTWPCADPSFCRVATLETSQKLICAWTHTSKSQCSFLVIDVIWSHYLCNLAQPFPCVSNCFCVYCKQILQNTKSSPLYNSKNDDDCTVLANFLLHALTSWQWISRSACWLFAKLAPTDTWRESSSGGARTIRSVWITKKASWTASESSDQLTGEAPRPDNSRWLGFFLHALSS